MVVGTWTGKHINVACGTTYCIDAREALTNENGEFEIPDVSRGTFRISIYKVGYKRVQCIWKYMRDWGACYVEPVELDGDRAVFPLEKVAEGRLEYEGSPPFITCGPKNGKPLTEYHNARREYRRARGLKP